MNIPYLREMHSKIACLYHSIMILEERAAGIEDGKTKVLTFCHFSTDIDRETAMKMVEAYKEVTLKQIARLNELINKHNAK